MTELVGKMMELAERRLAFENCCLTVYMDHVRTSLVYKVQDYIVDVPKIVSEDLTSGVAVLPCRVENVGLVTFYRHPVNEKVW